MKIITDALSTIATSLDVDFIRTINLTEADLINHKRPTAKDLMIYNGASNVTNEFEGAEIIDVVTCEIYFLTKSPTKDMDGAEVDTALAIAKRYCDQTYAALNISDIVVKDIEPYELEGVNVLTDIFLGYLMIVGIPVSNTGC